MNREPIADEGTQPSPSPAQSPLAHRPVAWRMLRSDGEVLRIRSDPFHEGFAKMMVVDYGCIIQPLFARPCSPDREAVARIIDPTAWELFDEVVRCQLLPQRLAQEAFEKCPDAPALAKERTEASLAKADEISALGPTGSEPSYDEGNPATDEKNPLPQDQGQ